MITTTEIKYKSSKNYTLYESGQIKQDILPDGHVIEWYENGQIKSIIKKYGEKNIVWWMTCVILMRLGIYGWRDLS